MTGKQAIFEYLKTHSIFCAPDVATAFGMTTASVTQAANILAKEGSLTVSGKVWRTVYYRLTTQDEKEGRKSTNLIFQECRNSEAMKRVLSVYGRTQA
ncbi:protein ren [Kosakonia sacchari]|uniref:protein ren n=1 Tax=Kosakonia sacchari TaxID=1158459 RepID=UPI00080747B4|nr:protein ren [Kosakonia sacchari]ANR76983.1 protein ren [Kosakonia sacchari]